MGNRFFDIAFTPAVMAEQERHGSRAAYAAWSARGAAASDDNALGPEEVEFITERDGFYVATVSETGWPYVQFRGGPVGFVRVPDASTLAWADFRGNRQYVTLGNVATNDRVALFFMDYRRRRRLKVLGRLRSSEIARPSDLPAGLAIARYPARVEHEMRVEVVAFDWNCPQHIPQRFTIGEVDRLTAALRDRIALLEQRLAASGAEIPDQV